MFKRAAVLVVSCGAVLAGCGTDPQIITHELGHTIGLRHTDYYDRSISCGGTFNPEPATGVGAIVIPGTPPATPGGRS